MGSEILSPLEKLVLTKLRKGPLYANTFRHAKPVVARLISRGIIRRVAPVGSTRKNMLEVVDV